MLIKYKAFENRESAESVVSTCLQAQGLDIFLNDSTI